MTGCARCSCTIPSRSSACSTRLLWTTMHSRARTDTRCAALPAALITTTSRTRFAAFRLSASTPWPEPPERRGRGRQRRSSSAARLGMPTSKWKRSGCALRIVCAAAVPGCVLHQDSFVRLLPAYPVSRPAAVFASPGLSGCPTNGWAARGAPELHLGVRQPLERDPAPFQPICPPSTHTCPCSQVAIGMSRRCFGWVLQVCARFQTIVGIRELAAPPAPRAGDPGRKISMCMRLILIASCGYVGYVGSDTHFYTQM